MPQRTGIARLESSGRQVAEISVAAGYRPRTIVARADIPLRLIFHRDDDDACSERVVFGSPRLERRLARRGTTTIDLPAHPAGEIRFTCGMGRYRGLIRLEPEPSSIIAEFRYRLRRVETTLAMAGIMWVCILPVIAIVAILAFDLTAALLASIVALIVLVAGCFWTFGRSQQTMGATGHGHGASRHDEELADHAIPGQPPERKI
ncbi:MAG: cupredoxin domain-containing protein [Chloroflexota bacterium]